MHVANTGSPPQLFQARIPVVVVGHFTSATSTRFVSNTIMVKHSGDLHRPVPEPGQGDVDGPRLLMVDAHLGTIGVWLAFVACIAGVVVIVVGLLPPPRRRRRRPGAPRRAGAG